MTLSRPAAATDTSTTAARDASATVARDVSPAAARDGSAVAEVLHDGSPARPCGWCDGPIPATARRDAETCSTRCRQARHRFNRDAGGTRRFAATRPLRLAYADPPYPGKAHLYRDHPDYGGEVDHAELIRRLCSFDGWALSTSAAALQGVLASCPPGVRVAAWHRGAPRGRSWSPLPAWEPVIYVEARGLDPSTVDARRLDALVHGVTPMTTLPTRVIGAKPAAFCAWLFGLLGALPGDELCDLFPGSGAVSRAWQAYATSSLTNGTGRGSDHTSHGPPGPQTRS